MEVLVEGRAGGMPRASWGAPAATDRDFEESRAARGVAGFAH